MARDVDGTRVLARMAEIDRRKLAAGMKADEAKDVAQRKAWRDSKRRQRAAKAKQGVQVRTSVINQCDSERELPTFDQLFGEPIKSVTKPNEIRENLNKLSVDKRAPASARVTALRTLAEMDGLVGKLQNKPNNTADQPLASMTREQLEAELARLRAEVAGRGT